MGFHLSLKELDVPISPFPFLRTLSVQRRRVDQSDCEEDCGQGGEHCGEVSGVCELRFRERASGRLG